MPWEAIADAEGQAGYAFKELWRHGPTDAGVGLQIAQAPGRIRGAGAGPGAFYLLLVVAAVE